MKRVESELAGRVQRIAEIEELLFEINVKIIQKF